MQCQQVRQALNLYLDGVLSEQERALVETHLESCDQCALELEGLSDTVSLVRSLPTVAPEPEAAEVVMAAIGGGREQREVVGCRRVHGAMVAIADGAASATERHAVLGHVEQCPECATALAGQIEAELAVAVLPEVRPPASLEWAIIARTTRASAPARRVRHEVPRWTVLRWALAPAAAAALIGIALLVPRSQPPVTVSSAPERAVATAPAVIASEPATQQPVVVAEAPETTAPAAAVSVRASRSAQMRRTAGRGVSPTAGSASAKPSAAAVAEPSNAATTGVAGRTSVPTVRRDLVPAGPAVELAAVGGAGEIPSREARAVSSAATAAQPAPAAVKVVRAEPAATATGATLAPVRAQPEEYALARTDFSRERGRLESHLTSDRYASFEVSLSSF